MKTPTDDADRLIRSLTQRLLADSKAPDHRLSPLEERLLAIAKFLLIECIICVRANRIEATGEPIDRIPVDAGIVTEGARLALAAAVELEAPLREIRDRMEVGR